MKNIHLLFLILFSSSFLAAQSPIVVTPDIFQIDTLGVDISDYYGFYLIMDGNIENTTGEMINVGWKRHLGSNCPENWDFITGTSIITYPPQVDESPEAIPLSPFEDNAFYEVQLLPRSTPGCCSFYIEFYNFNDPNIKYDTTHYFLRVNDENCLVSSTKPLNIDQSLIKTFPNPAENYLFIDSEYSIDRFSLINSVGELILTRSMDFNSPIDVTSLDSGVYFILLYHQGEMVGRSRFVKY